MERLADARFHAPMSDTITPILVLGATGKTGRRVAERLTARGVPVRAGSRSGTPPFDWDDRSTWAPAVAGAGAVYISYFPDLAVPGAPETVSAFARVAVEHGVRRLVLLSGRGEAEAQRSEELVRRSGAEWTIIRASWFSQNFAESFMLDGVRSGVIALPADGVREPFVDAEDIADIAAAALTGHGHAGRLYEVTGPRLLSFADAAAEIAQATGRDVRFVPVPMDEYAAALEAEGVPPATIALLRFLFTEVLDGRNASLTDGVERALGRLPRDFRDFARATAASGAWAP
jgi:uncharacterized protein YbjT (DUF2867 family)